MAFASWIPPSRGLGMPRYGLGLFNANSATHKRQNGMVPKFFAAYCGQISKDNMVADAYYGVHQNDVAGKYSSASTGIIPVIGCSMATDDHVMTTATIATGADDAHWQLMVNNMAHGAGYKEVWVRLGYEAALHTTGSGYNGTSTWAAPWKVAFEHVSTVMRNYAATIPGFTLRIVFDTVYLNYAEPGHNTLNLFKPDAAFYDLMSVDFYTGNLYPETLRPWPGYAAAAPFTLNWAKGPAVVGANVDTWATDYSPHAAPNGQGYTYDNLAHFFAFADAGDTLPNGGGGQSFYSLVQACAADQKPLMHGECGMISWGGEPGQGKSAGNGYKDISTTPVDALNGNYIAGNDLNFFPYLKRIWAQIETQFGVPCLGAILWDRSNGTLMSGPDAISGNMHPGMRPTAQVFNYPIGQYGTVDPILVVNDIPALAPNVPTSIRVDANFDLALANLTIDFGFGNGPQVASTIGGSALVGTQSATIPFTPTVSGPFNVIAQDTVRGYSSPPSDYVVSGAAAPSGGGGGGNVYRQTWNVGAWLDFVIQQADGNPSLTILAEVSNGSCQFDYYVSTGNTHPFDGVLHQGITGGNLNIQGLTPNVKNNIRVYFSNNGNGAYSHLKVTGAQLNSGSTPGQAPKGLPRIKLYGDSISEAIFNHYTDCYWHLIAKRMPGYDFITQSSSGSGWLRAGEGGASLNAAWNKVDLTPDVSLLDSNGHISAYGGTGTETDGIFINHGTNEELHGGFSDAQIVSEVTARLIAFRGALKSSSVISVIIPFGLYDTVSFPNGPQIITDIKNGVAPVATSQNIKIIDLGSAFSASLRSKSETVDGIHPNQAGHADIATTMAPLVITQMGNVITPPTQVTHKWTTAGGLNASAFTLSNNNLTVHRAQSSAANIWTSIFADAIIPDGTKTYFEVDVTGCVTGTASGVGVAWAAGGFKTDPSSTNLNNAAYHVWDEYNGAAAEVTNGVSVNPINPRQWTGNTQPPGWQLTPGAGLEGFTYIDVNGNVHLGYATANSSLALSIGNTQAHVVWGGAAGLTTTVGVLVDQINYQTTYISRVVSTGFQTTIGPFPIPFRHPLTPIVGCQTAFLLSGGLTAVMNGGSAGFKIGLPAGYTAYDGTTGGVVVPPGGIKSIALETIGINNQVVAGQPYSFVGHADQPWRSVNDVWATTQETSTGKIFKQANTVGQTVTLSADGLVATISNITSGLLTPHTAAIKDNLSGTESNNISYLVVKTAPPPLVIGNISVTTSASSFINAPYIAVGIADNPWISPDNVLVSIQATGSTKQYVQASTASGVTVALSVDKKTVTVSGLVSGVAGPHTLFMRDSASGTESPGFAYTITPIVVVPTITVIALQPIGIKRQDGLGQVNSTEAFNISGIADQPFTDVNNVLLSITPTGVAPVFTTPPSVTLSSDRKTATITGVTSSLVTTAVAFLKDAASGTVSLGVNFVIAPAGTPPPVIIPPSTIIDQITLQPVGINGKVITGSSYSVVAVADAPWKNVNDVLLSATQGGTAQNFNVANGTGNQSVTLSDDGFTAIISNVVSNIPGEDSAPFVIYVKDGVTGTVSAPSTILLVPVGTVITTGISKIIIDPIGTNNNVEENTFLTITGHADSPFLSPDDVMVSTEVLVPTKFYVNANAAGYTVTLADNGLTAIVSQIPAGTLSAHIGYMEDAKSTIESNGEIYEVVPTAVDAPGMSKIALGPIGNTSANVLDTDVYSIFGVADAPWSDASNVLVSIQLVSSGLTNYVAAEDAGYTVTLSSNNTVATVAGIITLIDGDYIALMQDSGTHIISNQVNFHVIHAPVVQQTLITVQSFGNPVTATPFTVVGVADQPWTNAASVQISLALTPTQSFVAASTIGTVILSNDGKIATVGNITAPASGNYTAYLKDLGTGVVSAGLPFTITPTVVTNPSMTHITMQPIGTNGSVVADTVYSMSAVADGPWSTTLTNIQLSMQLSTAGQVWIGAQASGLTVVVNTTTRTVTISGIVSHVQGTYTGYIRDIGTGITATSGMQFVVGPAAVVPMTQIVVAHINDLVTSQSFSLTGVADHPWSSASNVLISIGATQSFVTAATTPGLAVALSQDKLTATVSGLTAPTTTGTFTAYMRDGAAGITSAGVAYNVTTSSPPLSVMTAITVQSVGSPTAVTANQPYTAVSRANGPWSSVAAIQISTQLATGSQSFVDPKTNGTNVAVTISSDKLTCTITGLTAGIQQTHVFYIRDTGSGPAPGVTSPGFSYEVGGAPVITAAWSEPPTVPVPALITPGHQIAIIGTYCNDNGVSWNVTSGQTSSSGFSNEASWKHGRDNMADNLGVSHAAMNGGNIFYGGHDHTHNGYQELGYVVSHANLVYTNPPYDYIPTVGSHLMVNGGSDVSPATGKTYAWNDPQAYTDIKNGLWDFYFSGCVDAMVAQRRPIFIFRPGYENNASFMPDFSGYDNSGSLSTWRAAMRHACMVVRNRAAQVGAYPLIGFNPCNATQNNPNIEASFAAIGADVQNVIQFDIYNGYWVLPSSALAGVDTSGKVSGVGPSQANLISAWNGTAGGWSWNQCAALALKYGMPMYISESGSSGGDHHMLNDPYFFPYLASAVNAFRAAGGVFLGINIWSVGASDGNTNIQNGNQAATAASLRGVIGTMTGSSFDPATIKFGGTKRIGAP